jgi:hypothetical protein
MSQAIGILELTSIAKGMELGDAMLANVTLLVSKTLCPGKFLSWWEAMSAQSSRLLPRATARPERCWSTAWSSQYSCQRAACDQRS